MHDEPPSAFTATGRSKHFALEKAYQSPCTSQRQHRLFSRLAFDLLKIETVGLHDRFYSRNLCIVDKIFMDADEQRSVNVRLPGDEPIGGERQHAFRRRYAPQLL